MSFIVFLICKVPFLSIGDRSYLFVKYLPGIYLSFDFPLQLSNRIESWSRIKCQISTCYCPKTLFVHSYYINISTGISKDRNHKAFHKISMNRTDFLIDWWDKIYYTMYRSLPEYRPFSIKSITFMSNLLRILSKRLWKTV